MRRASYLVQIAFGLSLVSMTPWSLADCEGARISCIEYNQLIEKGQALKAAGQGLPDENGLNNYQKALELFEAAFHKAKTLPQQGKALHFYGEVLAYQRRFPEALSYVTKARRLLGDATPTELDKLALNLENALAKAPVTKQRLLRGLGRVRESDGLLQTNASLSPNSGAALRESVDIKLNFQVDSTQLEPETEANVAALAEMLMDDAMVTKRFVFVGHTDVRGEEDHNWQLSQSRAEVIAQRIAQQYPELKARIKTEWRGESEPLYKGDTEEIHRYNRRLEVIVEEK